MSGSGTDVGTGAGSQPDFGGGGGDVYDALAGYFGPGQYVARIFRGYERELNTLLVEKKRSETLDYDIKYNRAGFFRNLCDGPSEPLME